MNPIDCKRSGLSAARVIRKPGYMLRISEFVAVFTSFLLVVSCLPVQIEPSVNDMQAPSLLEGESIDPLAIQLRFDEAVQANKEDFLVSIGDEPLPIDSVDASGSVVTVRCERPTGPGVECRISGRIVDPSGNSTWVDTKILGFNDRVPRLLINELLTEKGTKHRDFIELLALSDGNLGGVTVYVGSEANHEYRYVFPCAEVRSGEYIVLHLKPDGQEIDETDPDTRSIGIDATDAGRDFWFPGQGALPDSTGVVTLYERPRGALLDAVLYAGKPSSSAGGFGKKVTFLAACDAVHALAWQAADAIPTWDDCARAADCTSTRSLSRWSSGEDDDSLDNWHVTPSGGLTPGAVNDDRVYKPIE
jgi:hypothetical protein